MKDRAALRAYLSLVENSLYPAEVNQLICFTIVVKSSQINLCLYMVLQIFIRLEEKNKKLKLHCSTKLQY